MKNYMVIARIKGVDYLTKVEAESEYNAEHKILDLGICGKRDYSAVDVCLASGVMEIKYAGIIEIYPRKATNIFVLDAAMHTLAKTHDIIKITNNWLRAFEKRA